MNKIDCRCKTCLREQESKKKLEELINIKGIDFSYNFYINEIAPNLLKNKENKELISLYESDMELLNRYKRIDKISNVLNAEDSSKSKIQTISNIE